MSFLLSFLFVQVWSQDQSGFTHFFINPYVLNASYAGMDGQASASLIYRRQWMNIDGGPTITNLSLHAPLNGRLSAGVNINNDAKGFFNNSTLLFTAAYHVPVHDYSFVRFGLSVGGSWNTVDMKKLEGINDPALADVLDNNASLAGNAGVSFHHRTFNFGVSLPSIFSPSYVSEDAFTVKEVRPFQAMVIHATNRFYFNNNKNIFEPYLLYHLNTDLPSQFELAGIVHLNHLVWAGASYKQYFGVSALGGIKLKNALAIGASYTIQQSGFDELNSPSFEVSVNYLFGKHRRDAHVYSFVNAVKPRESRTAATAQRTSSWRQKQVEAEKQRREEAAKLRAEQEEKRVQAAAEAKAKREQAAAEAQARKERAANEAQVRKQQTQALVQANPNPSVTTAPQRVEPEVVQEPQKNAGNVQAPAERDAVAGPVPVTRTENVVAQSQPEQKAPSPSEEKNVVVAKNQTDQKSPAPTPGEEPRRPVQQPPVKTVAEPVKISAPVQPQQEEAPPVQPQQEETARVQPRQSQPQQPVPATTRPTVTEAPPVQQDASQPVVVQNDPPKALAEETPVKAETPQENVAEETKPVAVAASSPGGVRHETFKRGNHQQELPASEYVVVGSFKSIENARHFADGLKNLNYAAKFGHLTASGLWYVYLVKTNDSQKAKTEQQRLSKIFLLRDAWLLTVQP